MQVSRHIRGWRGLGVLVGMTFTVAALVLGCQGPPGPPGPSGSAGAAGAGAAGSGMVSGKITNSITGGPVVGAKIAVDPAIQGQSPTTDNTGAFSATLPIGSYKLSVTRDGFTAATDTLVLVGGQTVTKNITLRPASRVAVNAGVQQETNPGGTVTLKATAEPLDGSTVSGYEWTQLSGVTATLANAKTDTLSVTLDKAPAYKAQLVKNIESLDRFNVQGISPHVIGDTKTSTFTVTVTTSSGKYTGKVAVTAKLPYDVTLGIQDVPQGIPVLLNGKQQSSYNWTIAGPAGSKADLDEPAKRNPVFTPDVAGKYVLTEKVSGATLNVFAGTWSGAITGQDAKGNPLAAGCTTCHDGKTAPDQFTAWSQSGHSHIFTKNMNDAGGHWTEACASCHGVGYTPAITNGGWDEAMAAENWKAPPHGDPGLWTKMLTTNPKTTKEANIQCENCHGPNNGSTLHANDIIDPARISISADVCGSCHGEPPRHGRFQQWENSAHGDFELAIDDATVESRGATAAHCGRCHTGQGFLTWIEQGNLTKLIQGKNGDATVPELTAMGLTKNSVQPQTCVVCHDPHAEGTLSGAPGTNTATVRINGSTGLLPSGFKAEDVGKGAICMTCHNTRNGLHNDANAPANYTAPHTPSQTDILMGQNAYFVNTERSAHGLVKDTCVTCHMELTAPPTEFSLPGVGTNHGFKASIDVCGKCHTNSLNGEALQGSIKAKLQDLSNRMSKYLLAKMPANTMVLDYTPHASGGKSYDIKSDPVKITKDNIVSIESTEPHGQQGYIIKLKNSATVTYKPANEPSHSMDVTQVQVQLGDVTSDGKTPIIAPSDNLVKAGWNYFLVHGDGSEGVHNPSWINQILDASINALK
jgi:hypothetical protein